MIAFQLHAQPQRSVHNQRVTTSYTQKHLYANIPYWFKPYHKHNKYLCVQLDTCTDVNLMPESVYKLVFNDPQTAKLAKNDIDLTVYTRHSVDLIGKCTLYMLSKGTKQPIKVEFYIAKEEGSVLLSWETVFQLQLLDVKPRLEYLLPRAMLISSAADHPKREIHAHSTVLQKWKFNICPTYFYLYSTLRKHTKENHNCEIKGANSGTVPRTFQRHRLIPRWAISYSY